MNSDKTLAQQQVDWLFMYSIFSIDEYYAYTDNINNNIPFSIGYFINGKLKYISYLQEDPIN